MFTMYNTTCVHSLRLAKPYTVCLSIQDVIHILYSEEINIQFKIDNVHNTEDSIMHSIPKI